jgi:hypothetical protein
MERLLRERAERLSGEDGEEGSSSTTTQGVLVHGSRRIRAGSEGKFKEDFEAWVEGARRFHVDLNAAFAFPDPAVNDGATTLYHTVFWANENLPQLGPVSESIVASPEDPDVFEEFSLTSLAFIAAAYFPCHRSNRL